MELLLCLVYIVLTPPSYVYLILASAVRSGWGVTIYAGEGWREVDGRVRRRFDKPNVLPSPTTDNGMQRQFEFHDVDSTFQLYRQSATTSHRCVEVTYNLINHDENPCLRMFRAFRVTVYRDAQSLIKTLVGAVAVACTRCLWVRGFGVE